MKPHNGSAPGLPVEFQKIIHRRPHTAVFDSDKKDATVVGCRCGAHFTGDEAYRKHIK